MRTIGVLPKSVLILEYLGMICWRLLCYRLIITLRCPRRSIRRWLAY